MFGFGSRGKSSKKIYDDVFYFSENAMLDCNMYVLKDKEENLCLIDAGNGRSMDDTIKAMTKVDLDPKKLKKIFITHEHLDHVLGLYALMDMFGEGELEIIAHELTAKILRDGDEDKIAPRALGISAAQFGVEIKPLQVTEIKDGDSVEFGDFKFITIDTPGHSLGSLSFYESSKKLIFPGDVVFPQGSFGRFDFPGGSLSVLQNSIKKITELDVDILCSGHMPPVVGNANKSIARSYKNINMY